ncbi:MAG: hypothetical protein ACK53Y_20995, partial [bacterium]
KEYLKTLQPPPEYDMGETTILDGDTNNNTTALLLGQGISSTIATTTSSSVNTFTDMDATTTTRSQNLLISSSSSSSDDEDTDLPPQIHDKARKYRSLLSAYAGSMKPKGIGDLW